MKHPQAARTAFRFAPPLKGAHPAARPSRFRGCPRTACSAAIGLLVSHARLAVACAREDSTWK